MIDARVMVPLPAMRVRRVPFGGVLHRWGVILPGRAWLPCSVL